MAEDVSSLHRAAAIGNQLALVIGPAARRDSEELHRLHHRVPAPNKSEELALALREGRGDPVQQLLRFERLRGLRLGCFLQRPPLVGMTPVRPPPEPQDVVVDDPFEPRGCDHSHRNACPDQPLPEILRQIIRVPRGQPGAGAGLGNQLIRSANRVIRVNFGPVLAPLPGWRVDRPPPGEPTPSPSLRPCQARGQINSKELRNAGRQSVPFVPGTVRRMSGCDIQLLRERGCSRRFS